MFTWLLKKGTFTLLKNIGKGGGARSPWPPLFRRPCFNTWIGTLMNTLLNLLKGVSAMNEGVICKIMHLVMIMIFVIVTRDSYKMIAEAKSLKCDGSFSKQYLFQFSLSKDLTLPIGKLLCKYFSICLITNFFHLQEYLEFYKYLVSSKPISWICLVSVW